MAENVFLGDGAELTVRTTSDLSLNPGDQFTLIEFGGALSRPFAEVPDPTRVGGELVRWNFLYEDSSTSVEIADVLLAADFDENDVVDSLDLDAWELGFGASGAAHTDGDADVDGDAEGRDFLAWPQQNGREEAENLSHRSGLSLIPEPLALQLMAVCLVCLSATRQRA